MATRGGARKGAGRGKINYDSYKKQYLEKQQSILSKGGTMDQRMLSEKEFKARYKAMMNDRKKEISDGTRKKLGNITRDLVEDQAYKYSKKQAATFRKTVKQKGTIQEYRLGIISMDWDEIENRRDALEAQGLSFKEISHAISQEFFGSP